MDNTFMQAITGKEIRENMNRISMRRALFILTAIMMFTLNPVSVKANTNKDLSVATTYISRHYPGYKVRFVPEGKPNTMKLRTRKGKRVVYVEVLKSHAKGNLKGKRRSWGITTKGSYITYNRRVKKGKQVKSYCIWNPNTNYTDDVVAVVDNGFIR